MAEETENFADEVGDVDILDSNGAKTSCPIIKVEKKGLYYYATARCSNGTTQTRASSNINVAKGLACQACGY